MKHIVLIRHAKSEHNTWGTNDFERNLSPRGQLDAPMMGDRLAVQLANRALNLDVFACSSAHRADQTARLLAPRLNFPLEHIIWQDALYLASPRSMLETIQQWPDTVSTGLLLAHNPGISELAGYLSGEHIDQVPTCSILILALPVESWRQTDRGAQFVHIDYPACKDSE